jgi:Diacylglycerol kinase catalytic domain
VCAVEVKAIEAVIIGNPNSGSAGEEGYLERFAETLRAGGLEIEVLNTERPDHATELAAMAGDRLVIVQDRLPNLFLLLPLLPLLLMSL